MPVCETDGCRRPVKAGGLAVCKPCWRIRLAETTRRLTIPPGTRCAGCDNLDPTEQLELESPLGLSYAYTHRNPDCARATKSRIALTAGQPVTIVGHDTTLNLTLDQETAHHAA